MPVEFGFGSVRWSVEVGQESAIALKKLQLSICLGKTGGAGIFSRSGEVMNIVTCFGHTVSHWST